MRVGLVLGAGGMTGHGFHAGVLAALEDEVGFVAGEATVIVGTSAGSGVGALVRAGLSGRDLAARACGDPPSPRVAALIAKIGPPPGPGDFPPPTRRSGARSAAPAFLLQSFLRPWDARLGTLGAAALPEGTLPISAMAGSLGRLFPGRWPDRALWICAVRVDDGRRVVFGRHAAEPGPGRTIDGPRTPVGEAVAASSAVPGWFAPVVIDGHRYVDGGSWSPTNADVLAGTPLDVVIVSSPMSAAPRVAVSSVDGAGRLLHHTYLQAEIGQLRRQSGGPHVIVFEPTRTVLDAMGLNPMDPRRRTDTTRAARASAAARLRRGDLADLLRR